MGAARAVLFVDGNNWFHGLKTIGVDACDLDYRKLAAELLKGRSLAESLRVPCASSASRTFVRLGCRGGMALRRFPADAGRAGVNERPALPGWGAALATPTRFRPPCGGRMPGPRDRGGGRRSQ